MGTFSRFWHRFNDEPVGQEVELVFSGDGRVDAVLGRIARDIAVKPVNADITLRRRAGRLPRSPSPVVRSTSSRLGPR